MSVFDEFLDSMYGKEAPRKRTIAHVENSVPTPIQPPAASPKRAKVTPSQPLPYILTDREMSLADFQKELNADKEKLRRSTRQHGPIADKSQSLQQIQALEQSTSFPNSAPTAMSGRRNIPVSVSSSATPSPVVPRNTTPPYNRPSELLPTFATSASTPSAVPVHSLCMATQPLETLPLLRSRTQSAPDSEPHGQRSPQAIQSNSV